MVNISFPAPLLLCSFSQSVSQSQMSCFPRGWERGEGLAGGDLARPKGTKEGGLIHYAKYKSVVLIR